MYIAELVIESVVIRNFKLLNSLSAYQVGLFYLRGSEIHALIEQI